MSGLNLKKDLLGGGTILPGEVTVVSLPPDLRDIQAALLLEGKILEIKQDGHVMVSTEHGNITLHSENSTPLKNKQNIELHIESGNPPAKAVLRANTGDDKTHEKLKPARFDKLPSEMSLSQDAQKPDIEPLSVNSLISGARLEMRYLAIAPDNDEHISRPFIKSRKVVIPTAISTALTAVLTFEIDSDENVVNISIPYEKTSRALPNEKSKTQDKVIVKKPYINTAFNIENFKNITTLPFRAIAAQIIKTSGETLLNCKAPPRASKKAVMPREPLYTPARQAVINVHKILAPQIKFLRNNKNTPPDTTNLHYGSAPEEAMNNAVLDWRIGKMIATVEGYSANKGLPVLRISSPKLLAERLYTLDRNVTGLQIGIRLEIVVNTLAPEQIDISGPTQEKNAKSAASPPDIMAGEYPSYLQTPGIWTIMEEVHQSLSYVGENAVKNFNATLPSPSKPAQFGAGLLFFAAAMRFGDAQGWLGEKSVKILKRAGKSSLLDRLGEEFSKLSKSGEKRLSGDWRVMSVPLLWENNIQKAVIYTHHEKSLPDENDKNNKGGKTRFLIDLSFGNIGAVQLEGMFRPEEPKRLDIVLRSEESFSNAVKQQMQEAYNNALSEDEITGELSFQDHKPEWVRISSEKPQEYSKNV